MSRLIIISNRLPFSIDRAGEEIIVRQSSGGLVSAIKSFFEQANAGAEVYTDKVWIGSMDASPDDWKLAEETGTMRCDFKVVPVFPAKDVAAFPLFPFTGG